MKEEDLLKYLMNTCEQVQFTGAESVSAGSNKVNLHFNHPVKELVWYMGPLNSGVNGSASYVSLCQTST